jgi:hypothetical protein
MGALYPGPCGRRCVDCRDLAEFSWHMGPVPLGLALPSLIFMKIIERFQPLSVWGNPERREVIMVMDPSGPTEIAELMYADLVCWR